VPFFRWAAPILKCAARRWSEDDFQLLAARLRNFVSPQGALLDLGGGTGDLGVGVARALGARVIVVDPVTQMLLRAPADPLLAVRLASAEALPFPDSYFDALLCSDAFHHFRDQEAAVSEMVRVVRPGGGILILEMEGTGWSRLVAIVERMLGEPAAFKTADEMQRFMAERGIIGTATRERGSSYSFVGSVHRRS
jgi:ubiquinone/menaquinone biosynthesis C-methylase UbiE